MKLTHAGDLRIDGEPRVGVFISGTRDEVRAILDRFIPGDEVALIDPTDYDNWLTSQEEPLGTQ